MRIAGLELAGPFVAAPMAGVTSPAFRVMARRAGAALAYTEMVSAGGLVRGQGRTWGLCRVAPEERPVGLQLFGADPEVMLAAARLVAEMPVDLLDVNLGCPAKKIRRQGAGSALMDDPPRAAEVVAAAAEGAAGRLPVTVKLRLGFKREELEHSLPPVLAAGARAVTLHARTVKQGFAGQADWQAVARLAAWCPVPVIGNGDLRSGAQAARRLAAAGCAGVMIGRGALGNPWIFEEAADHLAGRPPRPVPVAERRAGLWEHMELARRHGGPNQALHFARQFMMWYSKGLPGSAAFRRVAGNARSLEELVAATEAYFAELEAAEAPEPGRREAAS
jgi:nifR3 family TIM-barrel protein